LAKAQARSEAISGKSITISVKAGEEGKLFGSVGTTDIAETAQKAGIDVARNEIRMPGGAFRNTGTYEVEIHLHPDVKAQLTVNVVPEE
jgi:large subunit ribosomal protein L9